MSGRAPAALAVAAMAAGLAVGACGPEITVERFRVAVAMIERCTSHSATDETCAEPDPTTAIIPVVVESTDRTKVTLYATELSDGTDRAYGGSRDGDALSLERSSRDESDAGCVYTVSDHLELVIDGNQISGSERRVSDEAGACNALGLRTVERTDWDWRGTRQ